MPRRESFYLVDKEPFVCYYSIKIKHLIEKL